MCLIHKIRVASLLALFGIIATSCSGGQSAYSSSTVPYTSTGNQTVTVKVVHNSTVGYYLVGPSGRALYTYKPDPSNSVTCTGYCQSIWSPFSVKSGAKVKVSSHITGVVSTFSYNGGDEVTLNSKALYYYSGDTSDTSINGQGIQGIWFVATVSK